MQFIYCLSSSPCRPLRKSLVMARKGTPRSCLSSSAPGRQSLSSRQRQGRTPPPSRSPFSCPPSRPQGSRCRRPVRGRPHKGRSAKRASPVSRIPSARMSRFATHCRAPRIPSWSRPRSPRRALWTTLLCISLPRREGGWSATWLCGAFVYVFSVTHSRQINDEFL